jgi:hypothetical protein
MKLPSPRVFRMLARLLLLLPFLYAAPGAAETVVVHAGLLLQHVDYVTVRGKDAP